MVKGYNGKKNIRQKEKEERRGGEGRVINKTITNGITNGIHPLINP